MSRYSIPAVVILLSFLLLGCSEEVGRGPETINRFRIASVVWDAPNGHAYRLSFFTPLLGEPTEFTGTVIDNGPAFAGGADSSVQEYLEGLTSEYARSLEPEACRSHFDVADRCPGEAPNLRLNTPSVTISFITERLEPDSPATAFFDDTADAIRKTIREGTLANEQSVMFWETGRYAPPPE